METYLGRDAGGRVLSGRIVRGVADHIDAVLWFSDLRGFTRITDTAPQHVIPCSMTMPTSSYRRFTNAAATFSS